VSAYISFGGVTVHHTITNCLAALHCLVAHRRLKLDLRCADKEASEFFSTYTAFLSLAEGRGPTGQKGPGMHPDYGAILVVDDSETNRDLLCRRLGRKGYSTTAATGGVEALALLESYPFDLVLLDVMMPDVDGLTVLKTIRQTYSASQLPIIMVTARQESTDIVEALELGANDYVTKPIDFPVALARIRTHLAHKRAEAALRDSEERYALAMQGANEGLWDWHLATNELYVSPRWKAILGLPEQEAVSKPDAWFSLVHPEDRARLYADIAAHCQGQTAHFENEHR
jgi:CheY-like chemotaxis protein